MGIGQKIFNVVLDTMSKTIVKSIDMYYGVRNRVRPLYYNITKKTPPTDIMVTKDGDHFIM